MSFTRRLVERLQQEVGLSFPDSQPTRAQHQKTGQVSRTYLVWEELVCGGGSRCREYIRWRHTSDPEGYSREAPIELHGTVRDLYAAPALMLIQVDGDWSVIDAAGAANLDRLGVHVQRAFSRSKPTPEDDDAALLADGNAWYSQAQIDDAADAPTGGPASACPPAKRRHAYGSQQDRNRQGL